MADLNTLRVSVATTSASAYGAMRKYAEALCSVLPASWYEVEAKDTGADAEKVHAEKKALYAELKKVEHSNPSVIWARVRKYGAEYMNPAKAADGDGGEGDGEGEGGNTKEARSLRVRMIEELITLHKAAKREGPALEGDLKNAHTFICSALAELKVDISKV
jgi:hypothetical protein